MKERIRTIMQDQHMSQQEFADFIGSSPATLSSIFNGRTHPSLKIYEQIVSKLPTLNPNWLLTGTGDMYNSAPSTPVATPLQSPEGVHEPMIDFDNPTPSAVSTAAVTPQQHGVRSTPSDYSPNIVKILDKEPRRVTEIRVYYDDQTYESFLPSKK